MQRGWIIIAAAAAMMAVSRPAAAQTTVIVLTPTSALQFDPSPDHAATFGGVPVVSSYRATYCLRADRTQCPVTVDLGKPTPDAAGKITAASVFGNILPNTEYVATVVAVGPAGVSGPSNATDPFGAPAVPRPPANAAIRQ